MAKPAKTSSTAMTEKSYSIQYPLLDTLHPVPRNFVPWRWSTTRRTSKEEQREQDKDAWLLHTTLLKLLGSNPYGDCICDVVGLDEDFQIVKDPASSFEYAHRPMCLTYPNPNFNDVHPQHATKHVAQRAAIHQFRKTARSKTGRKQFTKKLMSELEYHCGLHYYAPRIDKYAKCVCDFIEYGPLERTDQDQKDLENLRCNKCGYCCPSCSPSCHGLPPNKWELAQSKIATERRKKRPIHLTSERIRKPASRTTFPPRYDPGTIVRDVLRAVACNPHLVI
ncbi:MAG: hypothetical protein LQ337_004095 [Flavoplaca oasis]|nr:MAG: hypothetical protein LQ337_004095 [Flavoplaca oasis]